MRKYNSRVSLRNCHIMCSDNTVMSSMSFTDDDPYDQPITQHYSSEYGKMV